MTAISAGRLHAQITDDTEMLASLVDGADYSVPVPTCPEWTLRQLTTHVGRAQRWAAEIVSTRSPGPIPFREVPDGRLPDEPAGRPGWLRAGAARLTAALREAGDAPVWTNQGPGIASYWARRMTHETAVHRADGQIALGQEPVIDAEIAADGIDEWLGMVTGDPGDQTHSLAALWDGHSMHVHATDEGVTGEWTVRGGSGRLTLEPGHGKGDVAVRGPASALLLMLVRRLPPGGPGIEVIGDRAVLDTWLAHTAF